MDRTAWTYVLSTIPDKETRDRILSDLDIFMQGWSSHGRTVEGTAQILHGRLLLVTSAVNSGTISGCGIDASVHTIQQILSKHNLTLAPTLNIAYLDGDGVAQLCTRTEFRSLYERQLVDDNTLCVLAQPAFSAETDQMVVVRPLRKTWHADLVTSKAVM